MKLQQLRYIVEIVNHHLNVSATAINLYTSQPSISKQVKMLEDELGAQIFLRNGKHLTKITPIGKKIIKIAKNILHKIESIKTISEDQKHPKKTTLYIATTHTQACYILPSIIKMFLKKYPCISLYIQQGSPEQITDLVSRGNVDFVIVTEEFDLCDNLLMLPGYNWSCTIIVPKDHELNKIKNITVETLSRYPLVTYAFGFTGRFELEQAFSRIGLNPKIVFTATDSDIVKTYVRLGLGVGIISNIAINKSLDSDLVNLSTNNIFKINTTKIGFLKTTFLKTYMYDFIEIFADHLTRKVIDQALSDSSKKNIETIFKKISLPIF